MLDQISRVRNCRIQERFPRLLQRNSPFEISAQLPKQRRVTVREIGSFGGASTGLKPKNPSTQDPRHDRAAFGVEVHA